MIIFGLHPMNEKKYNYILHWIKQLSETRPELGNFAVCPYASQAKYIILDEELKKVKPRMGWEVVISVSYTHLTLPTKRIVKISVVAV